MSAPAALPALPGLDALFAGRAGDAHAAAARVLLQALAREFPAAGLAVTGSVGRLEHRPDSDLDLVVADHGFRRDAQFAAEHGGVRAAVVCLRPALTPEREARWPLLAGGDAALASMVRTARVVHDPAGAFAELRETVRRTDALRLERGAELRARYREEADRLLGAAGAAADGRSGPVLVRLLTLLLDAWCLERGVVRVAKEQPLLAQMAARDPALHALLAASLPATPRSLDPLARAAALLFAPARRAGAAPAGAAGAPA